MNQLQACPKCGTLVYNFKEGVCDFCWFTKQPYFETVDELPIITPYEKEGKIEWEVTPKV